MIRPNLDFRGFAGQIASGVIRRGDEVTVLPSRRSSRVARIATYDGDLEEAFAPMSVTVCLEDEVDISRGDMLVHAQTAPHSARRFDATVVWMNQKPLEPGRPYLLKQTTQSGQARVREIRYRIDMNSLAHQPVSQLQLNEIGVVSVEGQRALFFDPYSRNRATGAFILIDPLTNETLGAGMILQPHEGGRSTGRVSEAEREGARGHAALAIALPAGNSELAWALERRLFDQGYLVHIVEAPENLRQAVRTAIAAGLIAIVRVAGEEEAQIVRGAAGARRYYAVMPATGEVDSQARAILDELEASGRLRKQEGPLTGGAGI